MKCRDCKRKAIWIAQDKYVASYCQKHYSKMVPWLFGFEHKKVEEL